MLHVIDNFFATPDLIREHALGAPYEDWKGFDGEVYKRVSLVVVPGLQAMIEDVMGPVRMLGMGYRLNYAGELPNNSIHSDMGWGTHAAVVYLSKGIGGTAFWTHQETGESKISPGDLKLYDKLKDDWNNEEAWSMNMMIGLKFNRGLIYDNRYFHSRYPFEAFGDNPVNGRLIAVAFFTPTGETNDSSSDNSGCAEDSFNVEEVLRDDNVSEGGTL